MEYTLGQAGAVGGLLASGILKTSDFGAAKGWKKIFVIEGIITCGLGIVAYFILTDRPSTAKWLTQEEKGKHQIRRPCR